MHDARNPDEPPSPGMLFDLGEPQPAEPKDTPQHAPPRLRRPQREQGEMRIASLDELLPPDHEVRVVWDFVTSVDVTPLLKEIKAVEGMPGRDATDPHVLLALWLYATIDGIGSARKLDELCIDHLAYQWLRGGISLNYHTLADFRSQNTSFLDQLLTESVATLMLEGLVELKQVAQDGMRVRANAGASSFRREKTLKACLQKADEQVQALKNQLDEDPSAATRRQQAARERAARERQERLQRALHEREELLKLREQQKREKGTKFDEEKLRISTTDPEAQRMKMPDGGTRPGYNVQYATTTESGIVVGVAVTNVGSDSGEMQPMVEQVEQRHGQPPEAMLVDGGFTALDDIEQAEAKQVKVIAPIKNEASKIAKGENPYEPRPKDGPGVAAWRQRMGTPEAKLLYRQRASTAEWVNAGARNRGLYQVQVRGVQKVLAVALLHALAHNLLRAQALRRAKAAAS